MATYKVIQDIEAEDKLLGPLTLRQFIYAIIVIALGFLAFQLTITVNFVLAIPLLLPMIFFAVLAAPFGHDQSSELWMLAKVRFYLKPRKRIWDQNGMKELVTITVPKKEEKHYTDNLSQTEVRSRLQALANTIDSRGWAVKNVNVNLYNQPSYAMNGDSDRLVNPSSMPAEVPSYEIHAEDDMLDETTNPTAQHFTQMIASSEQAHRQQLLSSIQRKDESSESHQSQPSDPNDYWFLEQTPPAPKKDGYAVFDGAQKVMPHAEKAKQSEHTSTKMTEEEKQILDKIHKEKSKPKAAYSHMRRIKPISEQKEQLKQEKKAEPKEDKKTQEPPVTAQASPAILELAKNDDLNIATIARQAEKAQKLPPDDEVVISLR